MLRSVWTTALVVASCAGFAACGEELPDHEQVHAQVGTQTFLSSPRREVDVLLVVDDSASMAELQARLAQNFSGFAEVLGHPEVSLDFRIGITTSGGQGAGCEAPSEVSTDLGRFAMRSCMEHLEDFELEGQPLELGALACTEVCELDAEATTLQASTIRPDGERRVRPWLESISDQTNLPAGTELEDALTCFGPQGVSGCEFEAPLEAMYQALTRSSNPEDPAYGFLRPSAILMVVFMTDEVDCSVAPGGEGMFDPMGDKAFWPDDSADTPSSALCWNAGVQCSGDSANYASCEPVNKALDGQVGVADGEAVLQPLSRYIGLLEAIEAQKQELDPRAEVLVSVLGGVTSMGEPFYADAEDSAFQAEYGIGPGCVASSPESEGARIEALPPVRLRALVDHFSPGSLFAICENNYESTLDALLPKLRGGLYLGCFDYCAEDRDASTVVIEPDCVVEQHLSGQDSETMSECQRQDGAYVLEDGDCVPPPGHDACYRLLHDSEELGVASTDALSPECEDRDANLELRITRRSTALADGYVTLSCTLSAWPSIECPGLR